MAITLLDLNGFETGRTGAPFFVVTATPAIVTTTVRTGLRALEMTPAAASEQVNVVPAAGNRIVTSAFYVRFNTLPTTNVEIARLGNASGQGRFVFSGAGSDRFGVQIASGTVVDGGPNPVVVNTWYKVVFEMDSSGATMFLKASVDGGADFTQSSVQAAADCTGIALGTSRAETYTAYYDDWLLSVTDGDYEQLKALTEWTVEGLIPSSDGTHNIGTLGDFDSFTATAFQNSTTNGNTFIGHRPMQNANTANQVIRQELGTTAHYMEFGLENLSDVTDLVLAVMAAACHIESATSGASLAEARLLLSDNTEVLTTGSLSVINSTEDPGTTVTTRRRLTIAPSGGWDGTKVNGLKARVGFGDNDPDVNFIDFFIEVALTPVTTTPLTGTLFQKAPTFNTGAITKTYALSGTLFQKAPSFFTGAITATRNLAGTLFVKAPTFNTGVVTRGAVNLAGVLFQKSPTFSTGAVTSRRNIGGFLFQDESAWFSATSKVSHVLPGTLFQKAPTFFTGTVGRGAVNLSGVLFQKAPTFSTGAITRTTPLTGTLFQTSPTFNVGAVTVGAANLAGSLFQKAPSFFAGSVTSVRNLAGTLFVKSPTFVTGSVTSVRNLAGTLFQRAPTFVTGALTSTRNLTGTLFQKSPTFFTGTVTRGAVNLAGVLFQKAPTFVSGTITAGANSLVGFVFQKAPTFFTGTVTPGARNLAGTLFQKSPTFFTGAVTSTRNLSGTLFTKAPTFPLGVVRLQQALTGTLFQRAPVFSTGSLTSVRALSGTLFQRAPTFAVGAVTAVRSIDGILFVRSPVFFTGQVLHGGQLVGILFIEVPTFFQGSVARKDYTREWPVSVGGEWSGDRADEWPISSGTRWPASSGVGWPVSTGDEWPQPPEA